MNQILVTEKLYITPELRRKKKMYKIQFFLSVFLVCLLFSYYIYADYDRNKSEEVSKEILEGIQTSSLRNDNEIKDTTVKKYDGMIVIAIDDEADQTPKPIQNLSREYVAEDGTVYAVDATLSIPALDINYPVLADWSDELLKVSLNKYWGPEANEVGNYCIVGHNYRSGKMFGTLSDIADGEIIELTDTKYGRTVKYAVYDRYQIDPTNTTCTSQLTGGKKEITLITCKEYGTQRFVVKAREVK